MLHTFLLYNGDVTLIMEKSKWVFQVMLDGTPDSCFTSTRIRELTLFETNSIKIITDKCNELFHLKHVTSADAQH